MYKFIFLLYLSCFALYILFTRQPDFFDGDMAKATIIQTTENGQPKMYAQFTEGSHQWNAAVAYPWLFTKGEQVNVMYEKSNMANAKVFSFLGYWITIGELVGSVILWVVLFRVAIAVTKNPTPEGLISEIETGYSGKRKYDD